MKKSAIYRPETHIHVRFQETAPFKQVKLRLHFIKMKWQHIQVLRSQCPAKQKQGRALSALLLAFSLTLTACGGGGGGGSTTPTTPDPVLQPTSTMDEQFGLYLTDLSNNHILPGYQLLADNATDFDSQVERFCSLNAPTDVNLNLLRLSWLEVNLQWQTMQWIKLGSVVKENRLLRLQFFPDDQNAVGKGIDSLLATQQTVDVAYVATHNAGGQGIPAAERLLFASESLLTASNRQKRCEVLQAIAINIADITEEVNNAWQPTGDNYINQLLSGTGDFSGRKDSVEELVGNWLEQLERVKDEKMLIPLGNNAPGLPTETEFYYSRTSLASIKINLQMFKLIYSAGDGHGFNKILASHLGQAAIDVAMSDSIDKVIAKVDSIQGFLDEQLASATGREQVKDLITAMQDFRTILTADFVQATDIYIGFNSNDGD
ncbi:MAG: imelysin family protein [Psychrosphaera sp.]|nr:imelysin family protein [Psychrosphaera sp.]